MDLNFEYNQDIVIDGKKYVLNHVENDDLGDRIRIRRQYLRWDGKLRKYFEQIVMKPPQPAPVASCPPSAPAPSASEAPGTPAAGAAPVASQAEKSSPAPKQEQRGVLSRMFGKKKGKKQ